MTHIIPVSVELAGSLLLIGGYVSYRHGQAAPWAIRAELVLAVGALCYALIGAILYWHTFGINEHVLAVLRTTRPSIGGICVGIFISLILSGQLWKIGRRPKKEQ